MAHDCYSNNDCTTIPNNLSCVNLIWNEIQYVCTWQVLRIVDCHGLGRIQGPGTERQFWCHPGWIWSLFQQFEKNFTVCQIKIDAVKLKLYHLYICNIILKHFLVKTFFEFSCQISGFLLLLVTSEDGKFGEIRNFINENFRWIRNTSRTKICKGASSFTQEHFYFILAHLWNLTFL